MKVRKNILWNWLRIIYPSCYGNRRKIVYAGLLIMTAFVCRAISPLIGRHIFDHAIPAKNLQLILILGFIWIGIMAIGAILIYFQNIFLCKVDVDLAKNLKVMVLRAFLIEFSSAENTEVKHGERLSRILTDPQVCVNKSGVGSLMDVAVSSASLVGIATITAYLDWPMTLMCLSGAILSIIFQHRVPHILAIWNQKVASSRAYATSFIENLISAWCLIIRHNKIEQETSLAETELGRLADAEISAWKQKCAAAMRNQIIVGSMPIILIWIGAYRMSRGLITMGTLIAFISYLWMINNYLSTAFNACFRISGGLGQAKDFMKVVDRTAKEAMFTNSTSGRERWLSIMFEELVLTAGQFTLKTNKICFTRGKVYLLTGDSGSGKSTFLEFLSGIRKPSQVRIFKNGKPYDIGSFISEARNFGYIRKEEALLDRTTRENMFYSVTKSDAGEIEDFAEIVKMKDKFSRTIDGLSAGEKQRISFVRELNRKPNMFIIDEGLDSLENDAKIRVLKLIREVLPESILVICTHNWQEYINIDGVLRISDGEIIQEQLSPSLNK